MDQLTSAPWNRRRLGRYRNRFQFGIDVVKEIKKRCGDDFPLLYRLDLTQAIQQTYGDRIFNDIFRGKERTIEEGLEFCKVLHEAGVDAFDVDKGCYENWFWPHPPSYFDDAIYAREIAGRLKYFFISEGIDCPVVAVGKLGRPEVAEKVLENKWADFIMLGRPLLADPQWPRKVMDDKTREIIHCIGDHEGCIESFKKGGHPCCSVNPYTGFEDSKRLVKAEKIKKVCIIGAGPAGCEAAITAHKRGHDVTLFEMSDHIGGQLYLGSKMPIKHDLSRYLDNLDFNLEKLSKEGLKIRFNTKVELNDVRGQYDVIICCNGPEIVLPSIEGMDNIRYMEAREFLGQDMLLPDDVKNVLVVGGGVVGCEIGYTLAHDAEVKVTVAGKNNDLMPDTVMANRNHMLWMMMGLGSTTGNPQDSLKEPVRVYNASKIIRFTDGKAHILANKGRRDPFTPWKALIPENVKNPFEKKLKPENVEHIIIDTDFVIFAMGSRSDDTLYFNLLKERAAREIFIAGDSKEPGRVWEAVTAANEIARSI